ncbi:unnamed protein product [Vitrella brassicaformis CCMP3155]|uniref:Cytochrome c oxidase subunit VIa n=2 Tax=Vitrella brassicaformis TaxID=1169539 RepID=A0A0G4EHG2_VITBC|nr:unnamed protein product [Vitrella brassicaformis CCMP3155]|eukprot:CEL95932.1 unnamed protein product [Vitrella brassicaformis CCMP3155]
MLLRLTRPLLTTNARVGARFPQSTPEFDPHLAHGKHAAIVHTGPPTTLPKGTPLMTHWWLLNFMLFSAGFGVVMTKWELNHYYSKHQKYYDTVWSKYHYCDLQYAWNTEHVPEPILIPSREGLPI